MQTHLTRFDDIAHLRQKKLALLVLLTNLAIAACATALTAIYDWNPRISNAEAIGIVVLIGMSWASLLVAAGAIGGFLGLFDAVSSAPSRFRKAIDERFLEKHRMTFFYAGVVVNLAALALFTEVTGGLGESPVVPLFVAFVLTGPQLSRFKTQAGVFLGVGIALAVAMVVCEKWASHPPSASPIQLPIASVFLALLAAGLLTLSEKPYSPVLGKHLRPPSHARLYWDGLGNWRVSFYQATHRQDPILSRNGDLDLATGVFPDGLKESFEQFSAVMARAADWDPPTHEWPEKCTTSFDVAFKYSGDRSA